MHTLEALYTLGAVSTSVRIRGDIITIDIATYFYTLSMSYDSTFVANRRDVMDTAP